MFTKTNLENNKFNVGSLREFNTFDLIFKISYSRHKHILIPLMKVKFSGAHLKALKFSLWLTQSTFFSRMFCVICHQTDC